MDTLDAHEMQDQLVNLVERAVQNNQQIRLIGPSGAAILMPEETYDNLMVTLELLSTPGMMETLRQASQCCSHECD